MLSQQPIEIVPIKSYFEQPTETVSDKPIKYVPKEFFWNSQSNMFQKNFSGTANIIISERINLFTANQNYSDCIKG